MIKSFNKKQPIISENVFIADNAVVQGEVILKENASVWYNAVLRGDINSIHVGQNSNIQDGCVLHVSNGKVGGSDFPVIIGDNVTVGHNATVHACTIGNNCIIGMGAVILDGAEIGDYSIVGANSLVPPGKKYPPRSLILGSPGKVAREITGADITFIKDSWSQYVIYAQQHNDLEK